MGGTRARMRVGAKGFGAEPKLQAQDQSADSNALDRAGDQASSSIAGSATPEQLRGMPSSLRVRRIQGLSRSEREQLFVAIGDDPALLDDLFAGTPDAEPRLLQRILAERFHKPVGTEGQATWDAGGLRRMYAVLAALPASHVAGNDRLGDFVKYADSDERYVHGSFGGDISLSYTPAQLSTTVHGEYVEETDALFGVNEFDAAARHEVGHAVDAKGGYSDKHMHEPMFGGWRLYPDALAWVDAIAKAANGELMKNHYAAGARGCLSVAINEDPSTNANGAVDPVAVTQALRTRYGQTITRNMSGVPESDRARLLADPLVDQIGRVLTGSKPWNDHDGGGAIKGRVFEESYKGQFTSYDAAARDPQRRCSLYQFRAPGEFFAEAYATYYEPVKAGEMKGKRLADVNKPLFDWFVKTFEKPENKDPKSPKKA